MKIRQKQLVLYQYKRVQDGLYQQKRLIISKRDGMQRKQLKYQNRANLIKAQERLGMVRLIFVIFLTLALFGCKSVNGPDPVAMDSYENVPITTTTGAILSTDQVRKIIVKSAEGSGWKVHNENEAGPVVAKYTYKEKHAATVKITYTQRGFSIQYENSTNLKYRIADGSDTYATPGTISGSRSFYPEGTKLIHGVYNQWIKALKDKIQAGFRAE
ncbi:MAG: hypothetical protein ACOYBR_05875 [Fluviibacter sp.]